MELTHRLGFLIVTGSLSARESKVAVEPTLAEAIGRWGASTRLSPLYGLRKDEPAIDEVLRAARALCFLGCASPASLPAHPEGVGLWATLGTFNIVAHSPDPETLLAFARQVNAEQSLQYEIWALDAEQRVTKVEHPPFAPGGMPDSLKAMAGYTDLSADLQTSVSEYCALMASSLARTEHALPALRAELLQVHEFAVTALNAIKASPPRSNLYQVMGVFAHLNAGLSRFCAQSLSGVSPIHQTECHFWIHSLLGTGVGNMALHTFAKFVASCMDRMNLSARLRALEGMAPVPDLHKVDADFWQGNHLRDVTPPAGAELPVPLLTYFSGRDGFRSGLNTVSAPLASVGACNSRQWSLMTMTHEIGHIVVRTVLAILYPDPTTPTGAEALQDYLADEKRTYLRQLRAFLLDTVVSMQQTAERLSSSRETRDWDTNRLSLLLDRWHHEIEEIMVHVLDFLYFYGQDTDRYVKAIWTTWGVIPNISNRVTEYVIRTLCAALAKHIRRSQGEETARQEVIRNLSELYAQTSGPYVQQALDLLNDETQWPQIRSQVVARKGLVRLVRGYLYWDEAAQAVRGDSALTSDASGHDGYKFKVKQVVTDLVDNPLRLVEEYTDSMQANEVASVWLLYLLAFNVRKS